MPDVVYVSIFFYLGLLELSQVFLIEVILHCWFVPIADVHAAKLFLTQKEVTLIKLDSRSSATIVWDLNFEPSLYRLGRLSSERKRRLMSIVWERSFGRFKGIWSEDELIDTWFFVGDEGITGLRFMCMFVGVEFGFAAIDANVAYTQFEFSMRMKGGLCMHYHYIIYL